MRGGGEGEALIEKGSSVLNEMGKSCSGWPMVLQKEEAVRGDNYEQVTM